VVLADRDLRARRAYVLQRVSRGVASEGVSWLGSSLQPDELKCSGEHRHRKFRTNKKTNDRKKENYTNGKLNKRNLRFSLVLRPDLERLRLNILFLPPVVDMTATGLALTMSRLPLP
jgi:hypothetical protein